MNTIELDTIQWSSLPDIDEVLPITAKDYAVLAELRSVLLKHGCTERFGICLLHKHFDLGEDEFLIETTDPETRTSTLSVRRSKEFPSDSIETVWRFSPTRNDSVAGRCLTRCESVGMHHRRKHITPPIKNEKP